MRRETDEPARRRIRTDLDANMLVEAGAGSGKTTLLVERLLEHVRVGTSVERLAAVTFTRKAANELRERFQLALEAAARRAAAGSDDAARFERALRDLERAFIGTIHAFCGRLLREHPLEIALDPNFQELTDTQWDDLQRSFWRRWVERARRNADPNVAALAAVGLDASELFTGFTQVVRYPDVAFVVGQAAVPDHAACRKQLDRLLERARVLMPRNEPAEGWDPLMLLVRRLDFQRTVTDWSDVAHFCAALEGIARSNIALTQKRWASDKEGKAAAKALADDWSALFDAEAAELLRCWRERRYAFVMPVLEAAAAEFARERHATGQLGFEDLLLLAARLLREHPVVREELGRRYAHLLVDEFQDTDPVQAEVCFLLASDDREGSDWRTVKPRPGALFVVGDPKQSIYRFRRADIGVYEFVKRRLAETGAVLSLTRNFRSVSSIEAVVNEYFNTAFPHEATAEQSEFQPMETQAEPEGRDGVYRYCLQMDGRTSDAAVVARDADAIAGWIATRIASGERRAEDFLVLTAGRKRMPRYARALAARNIPASTTGAPLPQEHELRELLVVLEAIADPENPVRVVAALEGVFSGLSPADLWEGSCAGIRFAITHAPEIADSATARALTQLHEWWKFSQRQSADVLLERILDDTGLLYHAASSDLGEARAGALLHLVSVVRAQVTAGAVSLVDVMQALEDFQTVEAPDAPLRPGRADVVRVMNLHKAKGLEAEVVILAAPIERSEHAPTVHVTRTAAGEPTGGLLVCDGGRVLAQPPGWAAMQEAEAKFEAAERERLLYVATTRARRELVVAQCEIQQKKGLKLDASPWRPLAAILEEHSLPLSVAAMDAAPIPGRRVANVHGGTLVAAAQAAAARVRDAATASFGVRAVTEGAKLSEPEPGGPQSRTPSLGPIAGAGAGIEWGRAVHEAIEGLGSGRRGESLAAYLRAVSRAHALTLEASAALEDLVAAVEQSEEWRQLVGTGGVLVELPVLQCTSVDGVERITEGVIDAAALGADGWFVVDWKSDTVADEVWNGRRAGYERQVAAYAAILTALTGQPARGIIKRV